MQINKTDNVIFLKEVESNVIKEAFVVLKDNIKIENNFEFNTFKKETYKIDILKEAEELINNVIDINNYNFEKYKIKKLQKKLKIQKMFNIFCVIIFIINILVK